MEFNPKTNTYVLSTGKEISCYNGVIGLSLKDNDTTIYEGYDDVLSFWKDLTREEEIEITRYIINVLTERLKALTGYRKG